MLSLSPMGSTGTARPYGEQYDHLMPDSTLCYTITLRKTGWQDEIGLGIGANR